MNQINYSKIFQNPREYAHNKISLYLQVSGHNSGEALSSVSVLQSKDCKLGSFSRKERPNTYCVLQNRQHRLKKRFPYVSDIGCCCLVF